MNKIKYILLLFLICSVLHAEVDFNFEGALPSNGEKLIISLGSGCDTGITLRDYGLRHAAFPFDWLISGNHEKFIMVLDDDFKFFTDESVFIPLDVPTDHPNPLKNTYYDIFFWHEGSVPYDWSDLEKYQEQLAKMKSKYERRIARFKQLRAFPGKVFFIRNFTSEPEQANRHPELAQELRDALRRYFPQLDFTLVIVTYADVNGAAIGNLDGIMEFIMDRGPWSREYEKMYQVLLSHF